jgi:hypothetical protein
LFSAASIFSLPFMVNYLLMIWVFSIITVQVWLLYSLPPRLDSYIIPLSKI